MNKRMMLNSISERNLVDMETTEEVHFRFLRPII
jgi:hypothetical protein